MRMDVEVFTGPPGCGKSRHMRAEAIQVRGLYLFAMPSVRLIKEQAKAFKGDDSQLRVFEAHYKSGGGGSVDEKLKLAREKVAELKLTRAAILTTHESLMGNDLSDFDQWHFRIDEAPNAVQSGKHSVTSAHTRKMLGEMFDLAPMRGGWSEVSPKYDRHRWREIAADDALKGFSEFIKHASRMTGAFVNVTDWQEKKFAWCAAWTPNLLEPFAASVKVAGASYSTSIGALIAERHAKINFVPVPLKRDRVGNPTVHIHYFTEGHAGSSALWEQSPGRGFIVKLCDRLAAKEPNLGFWSGNEEVQMLMDHRVHGGPIPPKIAGINEYDDRTSCALIYSAKPKDQDEPVRTLFQITDEEIRRAREDEDILQFVMRGALRKPDFDGEYNVYLYNKQQAERLAQQLGAGGFTKVTLVPEDAGFMDTPDPRPRVAAAKTPAQATVIGARGNPIQPKSQKRAEQRKRQKEREELAMQASAADPLAAE
jgi:hypothetical protein